MTVRVIVPMAPPREVSPNWTGNRYVKSRAVKMFRQAAGWAAVADGGGVQLNGADVGIDAIICWPKGHKVMDVENARSSLKAAIDGLQDARVFENDKLVKIRSVEQVTWGKQDTATRGMYPMGVTTLDIVVSESP